MTSSRPSRSSSPSTTPPARHRSRPTPQSAPSPMSPEPNDPVVLITGATGALGRVVAKRFARDGAHLALVGRDQGRLDELGKELDVGSDRWLAVPGDLAEADAGGAVANAVTSHWGRIDVLLHLVGGWAGGTAVVDLDPDEVRRMVDQHLWTTFHILQSAVPGMVERGLRAGDRRLLAARRRSGTEGRELRDREGGRGGARPVPRARGGRLRRHGEPRDRPHDRCQA